MSQSVAYDFEALAWVEGAAPAPATAAECRARAKNGNGLTWAHVVAHDLEETSRFLIEEFGLHPLEVEDALNSMERPHLQERDHMLFLVASEVVRTDEKAEFIDLGIFVFPRLLLTVSTRPSPTVATWMGRWQKQAVKFRGEVSYLVHALLDAVVDDYFPALDVLEEEMDTLEEAVFEGRRTRIEDILAMKRRLLRARQRLGPMRDVLNALLRRDIPLVPEEAQPYFQDVYDHTLRLLESIDLSRDVVATLLDAQVALIGNRTNEVMRVLTVISAVLMSAALVAGVYGMNFKFMPELDQAYGYPLSLGLMGAIAMLELWLFRRKRWL